MADIELVIKIPEKAYNALTHIEFDANLVVNEMRKAIEKGTPLPKEHGRLIDADAFIAMMEDASKRQKYKELLIDDCLTVDDVFKAIIESLLNKGLAEGDAPTIIKAESEVKRRGREWIWNTNNDDRAFRECWGYGI